MIKLIKSLTWRIFLLLGVPTLEPFGLIANTSDRISISGEIEYLNQRLDHGKIQFEGLKKRLNHIHNRLKFIQETTSTDDLSNSNPPLEQTNLHIKRMLEDGLPQIEQISGMVSLYNSQSRSFDPVEVGTSIKSPTLFSVSENAELIVSFPGKIAARVGENSRIVIGPAVNGRFEVDLRNGTISALLDPDRDKLNSPVFAIRTKSGVTEATGTFYAVTEYKGQAYAAVKKGKVKKETVPPTKPDFSAYLKKSAFSAPKQGASSKK